MFSDLSDKELVLMWHKLNTSQIGFKEYVKKEGLNKRLVEIDKELDYILFNKVNLEVKNRLINPHTLTKEI